MYVCMYVYPWVAVYVCVWELRNRLYVASDFSHLFAFHFLISLRLYYYCIHCLTLASHTMSALKLTSLVIRQKKWIKAVRRPGTLMCDINLMLVTAHHCNSDWDYCNLSGWTCGIICFWILRSLFIQALLLEYALISDVRFLFFVDRIVVLFCLYLI